MKTMIIIVMTLMTFNAYAVHKCEVNGKISYQNGPCIKKSERRAFEGPVSVVGTVNVRKNIADKAYAKEVEAQNKNIAKERLIEEAYIDAMQRQTRAMESMSHTKPKDDLIKIRPND